MSSPTIYVSPPAWVGELLTQYVVFKYLDRYRCARVSEESVDILQEGPFLLVAETYHRCQPLPALSHEEE